MHFNEHEFISSLSLSTGSSQASGIYSTSPPFPIPFIPTHSTPLPSATPPFAQSSATSPSAQPTDPQPTPSFTQSSATSHYTQPTDSSHPATPLYTHSPVSPHISPPPISTVPIQVPIIGNTHPMITRSKDGIFQPKVLVVMTDSVQCAPSKKAPSPPKPNYTLTEPPSFKIAAQHPQWCSAMAAKFDALHRQSTWVLVPPSPSQNVVGCKWVFKLKRNSDGSINKYKARLVAKGFHQQFGIDFDETFSPIVKPPTVRIILSLAVQFNWPLRQFDVSNAFLQWFS